MRQAGKSVMERPGGIAGFLIGFVASVVTAGVLVMFGGFLSFVNLVSDQPLTSTLPDNADAIVVLTGGDARLEAGMALLTEDKGRRLLISGVNADIGREEIRKLIDPGVHARFDCCVDLDKSAANTIGNATESARWAAQHSYTSVLVVTANYHMPRSLGEMNRVAPEITWIAYPVYPEDVHLKDWWKWRGSTRLLVSEYMKYLAMQIRFRVESA